MVSSHKQLLRQRALLRCLCSTANSSADQLRRCEPKRAASPDEPRIQLEFLSEATSNWVEPFFRVDPSEAAKQLQGLRLCFGAGPLF